MRMSHQGLDVGRIIVDNIITSGRRETFHAHAHKMYFKAQNKTYHITSYLFNALNNNYVSAQYTMPKISGAPGL
jgi:ribosomal protein L17